MESSFLSSTTSAFLPTSRLPRSSRPSACAPPRVAHSTTCSARSAAWVTVSPFRCASKCSRDRSAPSVVAHRGEQVAAPPDAGVHGQRHRDAVPPHLPGGRIALSRTLFRLGGHRDRPAGGGDAVVGVGGQRGGVHVHGLGLHEAAVVHLPDAVVAGRTPHPGMGGDRQARGRGPPRTRAFSGNAGSPVTSNASCTPFRDPCAVAVPLQERADRRVGRPFPRAGLDVAVRQDVPAGHRLQRVDGGLRVVNRLQAVRPVDDGGDARFERLERGQPVAGGDVLRPELAPVLQVVPDEVLGQGPVGAVTAHRGLPHVPVGVDHAGHEDAAAGVDLDGALRDVQTRRRPPAIESPTTSTSAPSRMVWVLSIVSTVPPRKTSDWDSSSRLLPSIDGQIVWVGGSLARRAGGSGRWIRWRCRGRAA